MTAKSKAQDPASLPVKATPAPNRAERDYARKLVDGLEGAARHVRISLQAEPNKTVLHVQDTAGIGGLLTLSNFATTAEAFGGWGIEKIAQATNGDERATNAALAGINDMKPTDPAEAMLLSQMMICHGTAMEMIGRQGRADTLDKFRYYERAANNFMRTYTTQLEALKRYRSKGEQVMRVERVYVGEGGQAIVGNVSHAPNGLSQESLTAPAPALSEQTNVRAINPPIETPLPRDVETAPRAVRQLRGAG